ncbi:ribosome small subunit-dependent GTPase A [Bacillus solimangrovi]|uniref:Small ribosomal subunit biogenesis GTPase RsgA n=1 Tax=Bacillus solimangrovi TaxID=1305675 RepID=A0A1E5LES7_9BACI|nr:ribosome small subunit-dependent GTPase A [Bacillus solimangrovi]OEH92581.1 ribosome small subunit-dependent GTPase A [Bacillus solimangrovi]
MNLNKLGWSETYNKAFELKNTDETFYVARIVGQGTDLYKIYSVHGESVAKLSGKFYYNVTERSEIPAVGDWVIVKGNHNEAVVIHDLLPRKSHFSRKIPGKTTEEQVVAANIDTVFLVSALNKDFNPRRIERYLTLAWESGANPVIVLNKADLCDDLTLKLAEVEGIAFGVPIHTISCKTGQGIAQLKSYFSTGQTVALIGSSGVGKSTITNALIGDSHQAVQTIREDDDKGRHTTTSRDLILLEQGMIIDTPGMRELQLWASDSSLSDAFQDIESLANQCRFRDCQHVNEPHCAVKKAINNGELTQARYESYKKLQKELAFFADPEQYKRQKDIIEMKNRKMAEQARKKK